MVFSSITFLFIFLPVTAALYFLPSLFLRSKRLIGFQNFVLCLASLFFYAWGEPVYIILMLLSIFFNYCIGLDMQQHEGDERIRKALLIFSLCFNLGVLAFFKYGGFIVSNINAILPWDINAAELPLPIGISFYTFQILSYVVDVYRHETRAQKNLLSFALYISMFPQLIAGPIVQYSSIDSQLENRSVTFNSAAAGIRLFIIGLSKKVLLANAAGAVFSEMTAQGTADLSALGAWLSMLFYTFQIYYDFSGYSDMAIGLGKIFGFDFPENFRYPYIAVSITDFWRRWHISLSSWFRDYLYIPLGGSRCSTRRNILNLMTVWLLTGLWHGAAWNFVLWGLYYGLLLLIEKYVFKKVIDRIPTAIRRFITFFFVIIGWVFFSSTSASQAFGMLGAMFGANGACNSSALYYLTSNLAPFAAMAAFATPLFAIKKRKRNRNSRAVLLIIEIALFAACIICLISDTYNPFLYFRF